MALRSSESATTALHSSLSCACWLHLMTTFCPPYAWHSSQASPRRLLLKNLYWDSSVLHPLNMPKLINPIAFNTSQQVYIITQINYLLLVGANPPVTPLLYWFTDSLQNYVPTNSFISVSYTHLDVYKRQIYIYLNSSYPNRPLSESLSGN